MVKERSVSPNSISPTLVMSRLQVRACDAIAIEKFAIPGIVLMENAGSAAAATILASLDCPARSRVCILAGVGNNAGDGFVVARHLTNHAVKVDILICGPRNRFTGDALTNLRIVENMHLPITCLDQSPPESLTSIITQHLAAADLIVDAMLGTGASGPPRQPIRSVIEILNTIDSPVVALDIPSGLDCDTGRPSEIAVRADQTVTFAALKKGFNTLDAARYTGKVTVASIGIDAAILQT